LLKISEQKTMSINIRSLLCSVTLLLAVVAMPGFAAEADELGVAVRNAVKRVDASVVRLRVIGGEQSIDGDKVTSLVTTGIVISEAGEILTSLFAVQGNPEAVLAEDNAGRRTNAKIVAIDHVRRLVLLKASEGQWVPAEVAPAESVKVGQWSVALGRFYSADSSSLSVGVVSALNRIHGMAIQSDAKISPVNYGGPLINLDGQVMGLLVPLSPGGQGNASSGVEWYDSGIGFAIPMQQALAVADRLRAGKDLKGGRLGVKLLSSGVFASRVVVDRVIPAGPADVGGIRKGDVLLTVNDRVIERMSMLEEAVGSRYAGDTLSFDVKRGDENLKFSVLLSEELPVIKPAYLGLMSVRTAKANEPPGEPETVAKIAPENVIPPDPPANAGDKKEAAARAAATLPALVVVNDSPAAEAGLPARIELIKVNNQATTRVSELAAALSEIQAGSKVSIEYRVPGEEASKSVEVMAKTQPEKVTHLSTEVLSAINDIGKAAQNADNPDADAAAGEVQVVDNISRRELSYEQRGRAIVYSSRVPTTVLPGIVILLASESESEEQILSRWKLLIDSHNLMVVLPVNPEKSRLTAEDIPLVMTVLKGLAGGAKADTGRIVVVSNREQARLAWQLSFEGPSPVRGIALTDGWISASDLAGTDGSDRSVLMLKSPENSESKALQTGSLESLQKAGFWTPLPASSEPEQNIADWSLLLRAF
jgi:serine protease Do